MKQQASHNIRVLVVDDEKIMRDGCSRILLQEGYKISSASSGEEAIERFDQEPFDLVLLDIKMPGMGGTKALRRLKEMDPGVTILIVPATLRSKQR